MGNKEKESGLGSLRAKVRDFFHGMACHEMGRMAIQYRASREHLLFLVTMGDLLGVPILPSYYSRRLLPSVVPQIPPWKRRMLREKDMTDWAGES